MFLFIYLFFYPEAVITKKTRCSECISKWLLCLLPAVKWKHTGFFSVLYCKNMVGILEVQLTKVCELVWVWWGPKTFLPWNFNFQIVHTKPLTISSNTVLSFLVLVLVPAENNFFCFWSSALRSCDFLYPNHLSNIEDSSLCLDLKFLLDLKKVVDFQFFRLLFLWWWEWWLASFLHSRPGRASFFHLYF